MSSKPVEEDVQNRRSREWFAESVRSKRDDRLAVLLRCLSSSRNQQNHFANFCRAHSDKSLPGISRAVGSPPRYDSDSVPVTVTDKLFSFMPGTQDFSLRLVTLWIPIHKGLSFGEVLLHGKDHQASRKALVFTTCIATGSPPWVFAAQSIPDKWRRATALEKLHTFSRSRRKPRATPPTCDQRFPWLFVDHKSWRPLLLNLGPG